MKFGPQTSNRQTPGGARPSLARCTATGRARLSPARRTAAFTLAEVLAALLFMAIVVPVAIEGLHIASLAGAVAERKGEAARVAQRLLNESLVTTNYNQSVQSGSLIEGQRKFNWTLHSDPWTQDPNQNAMMQL